MPFPEFTAFYCVFKHLFIVVGAFPLLLGVCSRVLFEYFKLSGKNMDVQGYPAGHFEVVLHLEGCRLVIKSFGSAFFFFLSFIRSSLMCIGENNTLLMAHV